MTDHAHNVGLVAFLINGIAHGLAVHGQGFILLAIGLVPALKGAVQVHRVDPDQDIANDREAGHEVAIVFTAAVTMGAYRICPGK